MGEGTGACMGGFSACNLLLLAAAAACCYFCWLAWKQPWRRHNGPASPPGGWGLLIPWLGEGLHYIAAMRAGQPDRFLLDRAARYASSTFRTVIFGQRIVMVQGATANRFLATSEIRGVLRNSWPTTVLRVVGEHAPVSKHGSEHRRFRQILASCLSPLALQKLVHRASLITQQHFDTHWLPHAHHSRSSAAPITAVSTSRGAHHPPALTLLPILKLHTFQIACNLLMNVTDEKVLSRLHAPFNTWLAGMLDVPVDFPGTPYRKALRARDELRREMGMLIDFKLGAQQCKARDGDKDVDVLSLLLKAQDENGGFLSHQEMQDVLLFLLFAGHDTNTTALAFTLKFLEQNPACYDRVVEEQEAIASKKQAGEQLNWSDVQSMKYTWKVIQETIRLRPPVIGSMKEAMEDVRFDNYLIPKGWKVFFSISRTHHDDMYFANASEFDPSRFDPERWKAEGTSGPPPFSYVPFGVGPHSCPGNEFARMTLCVYIHHLVRRFKWKSIYLNEKVEIFTMPSFANGYPITLYHKAKLE